MLLLPVAFCTPIYKHECDLNIGGGEGAYVIVCYNICDRDCSLTLSEMLHHQSYDSLMSKLLHYPKSVSAGTNAYWNHAKDHLKSILVQVGAPTIF